MSQSSEKNLLRFGCPACGIRLVVDQSVAGTEGPCPSCGARIVAPPLEVARSLTEKEAAPLVIKPRGVSTGPLSAPASEPADEFDMESIELEDRGESLPRPGSKTKPVKQSRSVSPTTVLSEKHMEAKNAKAFVKMLIAAAVVACIAVSVYYFLIKAQ